MENETARQAGHLPGALLEMAMGFQQAKLVLVGLELDLFARLAREPARPEGVCHELGLHPRSTGDFLDALVQLDLLREREGYYSSTDTAREFLVPGQPQFLGEFLQMANRVMYPAWGDLGELLRTGKPQASTYAGSDMFGELYADAQERDQLISMAENASRPLIPALVERFEWAEHASVVELGGCRGNVLAELVRAHPHLDARVFDLPQLEASFDEHMSELGLTGRVRFRGGDFFADPLPRADVLMIGHSLVDWAEEQRQEIVTRAFRAVRPGGAFLIWDPIIRRDSDSYLRNLLRSINLALMNPYGTGYSLEQCEAWLGAAGCSSVSSRSLGHDVTLVIGRKPA